MSKIGIFHHNVFRICHYSKIYKFKILQEIGQILIGRSKGELLRILGVTGIMTNDVMTMMNVGMTVEMTVGMTAAMIIGMIIGKFFTPITKLRQSFSE